MQADDIADVQSRYLPHPHASQPTQLYHAAIASRVAAASDVLEHTLLVSVCEHWGLLHGCCSLVHVSTAASVLSEAEKSNQRYLTIYRNNLSWLRAWLTECVFHEVAAQDAALVLAHAQTLASTQALRAC